MLDAIIVGSGPNGLAAAVTLARAGRSVEVFEAKAQIGGGAKAEELTLPGFIHDVCSAAHPLAIASPFFSELPLREHGLEWIHSPAAMAHPLDNEPAALLKPSLDETAAGLGEDERAYRRLFGTLSKEWPRLLPELLGPVRFPRHPLALALFGALALSPAGTLTRTAFRTSRARALFAGICAHSILPFSWAASSAVGLVLTHAGHGQGWPIPRGGSQSISHALASYLRSLGGTIHTSSPVVSLGQLPRSRAVIFDLTPRQILKIAGDRFTPGFRSGLSKYRYGPGVFKVDWALNGPIPWASSECGTAATVHVAGTLEEIERSEKGAWKGFPVERPYVLLTQPSLFDPSRAPAGHQTAWGYCHVPHGSTENRLEAIEAQIERFAPGFRSRILARHVMGPRDLEERNANLVGGDIGGGSADIGQLFLRPTRRLYRTSDPALFICSSSTPPGPGVHGMCGHHAALAVLRDLS
jgi:phytoene dehydrogenase-like protein